MIRDAAVRELRTESGLIAKRENLEKVAIITFIATLETGEEVEYKMITFLLRTWEGELSPNLKEMTEPTWMSVDALPQLEEHPDFMPADPYWLPRVLSGKKLIGVAVYAPNQASLLKPPDIKIQDRI